MTKWESKFIDFINKYMVHIGIFLVGIFALGIRFMARKYVGNDAPYELYDIRGNYHSYLYRLFVTQIVNLTEQAVFVLRMFAYIGDAGVFVLSSILLGRKWVLQDALRVFYLLTAIMLSPVLLLSSVSGMRLDSLSICLVLLAYLAYRKKWYVPGAVCMALSALIAPSFWLLGLAVSGYYVYAVIKKKESGVHYHTGGILLIVFLIAFTVFESMHFNGFREMKILGSAGLFLYGVGPAVATFFMIAAFKKPKLRVPALAVQAFFLMLMGYLQTYHTMIWVFE